MKHLLSPQLFYRHANIKTHHGLNRLESEGQNIWIYLEQASMPKLVDAQSLLSLIYESFDYFKELQRRNEKFEFTLAAP